MRLASGIAPVVQWRDKGVRVGLGVDGSASNDGGNLLTEVRQAMLLQRVAPDRYLSEKPGGRGGFAGIADAMSARQAIELATRGSASVLGRDDIGHLAPGMSADFIAFDLNQIAFAGALHDPVAAVALCQPSGVDLSVVNGKVVVENGRLTIILSLRADFISHCVRYPDLRALMNKQLQLVGAMDPPDLAKAITLPSLEVGAEIDPALVSRIMADMKVSQAHCR